MKGKIHKTEQGWVVQYGVINSIRSLPLHPDDVKQINRDAQVFDNIEARIAAYPEVEFEIVKEYIDSHTNQVQAYAKLLNH
jgi:hypothetical protein